MPATLPCESRLQDWSAHRPQTAMLIGGESLGPYKLLYRLTMHVTCDRADMPDWYFGNDKLYIQYCQLRAMLVEAQCHLPPRPFGAMLHPAEAAH